MAIAESRSCAEGRRRLPCRRSRTARATPTGKPKAGGARSQRGQAPLCHVSSPRLRTTLEVATRVGAAAPAIRPVSGHPRRRVLGMEEGSVITTCPRPGPRAPASRAPHGGNARPRGVGSTRGTASPEAKTRVRGGRSRGAPAAGRATERAAPPSPAGFGISPTAVRAWLAVGFGLEESFRSGR